MFCKPALADHVPAVPDHKASAFCFPVDFRIDSAGLFQTRGPTGGRVSLSLVIRSTYHGYYRPYVSRVCVI